jgi:hypothetical protein
MRRLRRAEGYWIKSNVTQGQHGRYGTVTQIRGMHGAVTGAPRTVCNASSTPTAIRSMFWSRFRRAFIIARAWSA